MSPFTNVAALLALSMMQSQVAHATQPDDVTQLIAIDKRMQRAFIDRDWTALDEILTDDYVLVSSSGNELTLLATDLEVALRSKCEAAVDKAGAVTLPAKKFYEVVRALPEADVKLETEKGGSGVKVSAERFQSNSYADLDPART